MNIDNIASDQLMTNEGLILRLQQSILSWTSKDVNIL